VDLSCHSVLRVIFAVLCELWWGSAAAWSQLCEWAGFRRDAKQPLREDLQTRNTQEVQHAGMQDQHRFEHTAQCVPSGLAGSLPIHRGSMCFNWTDLLVTITLNSLNIMCNAVFHGMWPVCALPSQVQFAGRTPCPLASVTSWSCWVAALLGRSKDSVVSPVGHSQTTPILQYGQITTTVIRTLSDVKPIKVLQKPKCYKQQYMWYIYIYTYIHIYVKTWLDDH